MLLSGTPADLAGRIAHASRLTWIFNQGGDYEACRAAEAFLKARSFSVGIMQGPEPRGILLGDIAIQKWRNLRAAEREALHGVMTGSMRSGPVRVVIFDTAPDHVIAAIGRMARAT